MFLECHTTIIWKQVENWTKTVTFNSLKLTDFDKFFGHQQRDKTINKIILITKLVIYKNRISDKHISKVKKMLYNDSCVKEYDSNLNNTDENFGEEHIKISKNTFFP